MGFKCKAKINLYKFVSGTLAPYYSRFWVQFHSRSQEHHMHWFCLDDLNCCVDGTSQKYAIVRALVLTIWHIQEGSDLTQKKSNNCYKKWGFPFTIVMFKIYLVPNRLVRAFCMCLLWVITTLCDWPMQVIGLQLVVVRWNGLPSSK
jgi:hypothetical protein